jgi:hypothetical protein
MNTELIGTIKLKDGNIIIGDPSYVNDKHWRKVVKKYILKNDRDFPLALCGCQCDIIDGVICECDRVGVCIPTNSNNL